MKRSIITTASFLVFTLFLSLPHAYAEQLPCSDKKKVRSPVFVSYINHWGNEANTILRSIEFCPCGGKVVVDPPPLYQQLSSRVTFKRAGNKGTISGVAIFNQGPPEPGVNKNNWTDRINFQFEVPSGKGRNMEHS